MEELESYVYEKYIKRMIVEIGGAKKISKEYLDKLELTPHERNFIMYVIGKNKIKVTTDKITKDDRSPYVRDDNYGDIEGHGLQEFDEPVMSKIEHSPNNIGEKVFEDYSELDKYLEEKFIPSYVLLKQRKNERGGVDYFPSIRLYHITALKLNEAEFKHVMDYLKGKGIRIGGKSANLDGEFENYDYVTTYKDSELPLSVPPQVTLQKISLYKQNQDPELREEIIRDNMRLIPYVVYKYALATGIDEHELEGYGYEGLISALEKFDINKGCAFSTYAIACIRGNVLNGIQEISQGKKSKFYYDYITAKIAVEKELGISISEAPELIEDVIELLVATGKIKNNDESIKTARRKATALELGNPSLDDDEQFEFLIEEGKLVDPHDYEAVVLDSSLKEDVKSVLDTLTEREADVIRIRFGFWDGKTHTLEEVSMIFGTTKERIRQIENKAIRKLRHPSRAKRLIDYYGNSGIEKYGDGIARKI